MATYLSKEDIIESSGVQNLESLLDLEILFLSFDEFASLENCTNLRRLSCIDNGLKRISNLSSLGMSLSVLCLCDQRLTAMDNLLLPNLRELFLHRNEITKIGNLSGCPRVRKLWLFQNKVENITGLHALPELEECWLQANQIRKLSGFENNPRLHTLGMAGNLVCSFKELKKLAPCSSLRSITFSDIHFGRCPVADEAGYKEFVLLHLRQVTVLDGIGVTREAQLSAEAVYFSQLRSFNSSLREVEEFYQRSLRDIEAQHQGREGYSNVLEKEMSAALKELQGLVSEGRSAIAKQANHTQQLMAGSAQTVSGQLGLLEAQAKHALREHLEEVHEEFDSAAALLSLAEQIAIAEAVIVNLLCDVSASAAVASTSGMNGMIGKNNKQTISSLDNSSSSSSGDMMKGAKKRCRIYFQTISHNAADFQMFSNLVNSSANSYGSGNDSMNGGGITNSGKKKVVGKQQQQQQQQQIDRLGTRNKMSFDSSGSSNSSNNSGSNNDINALEVARLYKIAIQYHHQQQQSSIYNDNIVYNGNISNNNGTSVGTLLMHENTRLSYDRVFTILSPTDLQIVLAEGWDSLRATPVFSSSADVLAVLYSSLGFDMTAQSASLPEEYAHILQTESIDDNVLLNLSAADALGKANKTTNISATTKLPKLQEALNTRIHLLISCKLYQEKMIASSNNAASPVSAVSSTNIVQLPVAKDLRKQFMIELQKIQRRPQKVLLQHPGYCSKSSSNDNDSTFSTTYQSPSKLGIASDPSTGRGILNESSNCSSMLYVVPASICNDCVVLDFVSLCVSPPTEGGGLRSIDHRLEPLLLPTNSVDHSAHILSTFEKNAADVVKQYMDQLLEDVDDVQASALRRAGAEVSHREGSLRGVREEVERERRTQEIMMRDLRQMTLAAAAANEGGNSNKPSATGYNNNNSNVQQQRRR